MSQGDVWEKEYRYPLLVTGDFKHQKFILRFVKFLKKQGFEIDKASVLDLGSGIGKATNYFAKLGADVVGIEISNTAIKKAKEFALENKIKNVRYLRQSIGEKYPFEDNSFDLVVDATSSNSLNDKERKVYLKEVARVLKKGGYFFVRTLRKEGDKNAKKMLKDNKGKEDGTYIMPGLGLVEKVFEDKEFVDLYSENFKIIKVIFESGYTNFVNKKYKRNFRVAYMRL